MKRKGWSPDNPNGEMRGKDEWERISWDEALDIIADQMKKVIDQYTTKGILVSASPNYGATYFDPVVCLHDALGGSVRSALATISVGAWPLPEILITGGYLAAPDHLSAMKSDLHLMFGCNWAANKGGNTAFQLNYAKEQGGKVIIIDPWLNQTAQAIADEWIPIRPGTDTALCLGMAYHQIENNLQDQAFLDKYCSGFDADHMPEGSPAEDNFKDYVLGTYDGEPKTPEWAEAICGVPAAKIRGLAEEVSATEKVDFFAGQSTTKIPAGEMFAQVFYTLAFMHGNTGSEGNYVSWIGRHEGMSTAPYVSAGDSASKELNPVNPLTPPTLGANTPVFSKIEDNDSWVHLDYSECWESILSGEYGRDVWPGGKRKIDIHMIYTGGYLNGMNSLPNANAAIRVYRSVDFVWGAHPFFCASAQYCDVLLPIATWWEKYEQAWKDSSDTLYWSDKILEPLYESRTENAVAEALAIRLGVDPKTINVMTDQERTYASISGATYMTNAETNETAPLLTITQEEIDELGVEGKPQEGAISFADFKEKGLYKVQRQIDDKLSFIPYKAFFEDPAANPLSTESGKFEIYCPSLAAIVNSLGYSQISPIGKWQTSSEQGQGAQSDDYPLLLWTPHTLRRAHSCNDNVVSLREAFPQECFMSEVDAEVRGIKNGDIVLMTSPYGKVLRPAKVLPTVVPGSVALQDGAWIQIDDETGIDIGGNPNILQAPSASGQGSQSWTGTLVQVEKYTGSIKLEPDKNRPIVMPVGVE